MKKYVESEKQVVARSNNFVYHKPVQDQPERYEKLRQEANLLSHLFNSLCPESRELSLAQTKLEEAVMWANASIARNEK